MSTLPRVLVPITYGFSVRYLVPTGLLDGLTEVCTPVVGLGWDDPDLEAELRSKGLEVTRLPEAALQHSYRRFRRQVAIVHQHRLASPTSAIQRAQRQSLTARPSAQLLGRLRRLRDQVVVRRPGGAAAVLAQEGAAIAGGTNIAEFEAFLRDAGIEAMLSITPYHDQDGLLLWAAGAAGLPTLVSVISFDNPTTRERIIGRADRLVVWNRYNADELRRAYPELGPDDVGVIGAPQFDLHHQADLVLDDAEWRRALGLPVDRPIILYGAGPSSLIPGEQRLVEMLDDAIGAGRIPGDPFLLVRRHPNDPPEPWAELGGRLRHGVVAEPWAPGATLFRSWPTRADLELQMSSLAHSAVHVNVCSSMTLDGAVFDRPQIGPTFVPGADAHDQGRVASYYRQEHWLPIARSGGLVTAADEAQFVAAVARGLSHPDEHRAGRVRMIEEVLTYADGRSSERLVGEVARLVGIRARS